MTPARTAIVAGAGPLPGLLATRLVDPVIARLEGAGPGEIAWRLERLVPFLDRLHDLGVARVVFAGAVRRPRFEAELFDARTAVLVPRLLAAREAGDDAALREVIAFFEEAGFAVIGPHDIAPDFVPGAGVLGAHAPSDADRRDAARASAVLAALGSADVGQGAVVAQGQCLAVETLPGTDAMLAWVAAVAGGFKPDPGGARGVLLKAPKAGQDRRIDLPTVGPATVAGAAAAGLAGIAFEAGSTLLLDPVACVEATDAAGLFLWARAPG